TLAWAATSAPVFWSMAASKRVVSISARTVPDFTLLLKSTYTLVMRPDTWAPTCTWRSGCTCPVDWMLSCTSPVETTAVTYLGGGLGAVLMRQSAAKPRAAAKASTAPRRRSHLRPSTRERSFSRALRSPPRTDAGPGRDAGPGPPLERELGGG